ncbi:MAG: hypothetical protein HWN65_17060 [Candidatus Helarchaeota archaeon]|nr:hypothetical protein [Candidatus Helarchaeota archaeon]
MTEISKPFKIAMIVIGGIALFYGIWWVFFTEAYYSMVGGIYEDPGALRGQGGTLLLFGIFNLIAALRLNWEQAKYYVEFAIGWMIIMLILNIVNLSDPNNTSTSVMMIWLNIALLAVFMAIVLYFYLQQEKKS